MPQCWGRFPSLSARDANAVKRVDTRDHNIGDGPMCAIIASLHAEHAEPRLRNRSTETRGQGKRKDGASLGGIEDPVVPKARRGVVRTPFRLVGVEDWLLEGAFLVSVHFF